MSTNTALDDIKAQVENALMHQNLDPSAYAELAWDVVAAAPKLLAALEAVEELSARWKATPKRPTAFDAAMHHAHIKLETAIQEALS